MCSKVKLGGRGWRGECCSGRVDERRRGVDKEHVERWMKDLILSLGRVERCLIHVVVDKFCCEVMWPVLLLDVSRLV